LSTTNPTRTDEGSNPSLRGERLVTNRLSHGTAMCVVFSNIYFVSIVYLYSVLYHTIQYMQPTKTNGAQKNGTNIYVNRQLTPAEDGANRDVETRLS
jgi:hypothetical protein